MYASAVDSSNVFYSSKSTRGGVGVEITCFVWKVFSLSVQKICPSLLSLSLSACQKRRLNFWVICVLNMVWIHFHKWQTEILSSFTNYKAFELLLDPLLPPSQSASLSFLYPSHLEWKTRKHEKWKFLELYLAGTNCPLERVRSPQDIEVPLRKNKYPAPGIFKKNQRLAPQVCWRGFTPCNWFRSVNRVL